MRKTALNPILSNAIADFKSTVGYDSRSSVCKAVNSALKSNQQACVAWAAYNGCDVESVLANTAKMINTISNTYERFVERYQKPQLISDLCYNELLHFLTISTSDMQNNVSGTVSSYSRLVDSQSTCDIAKLASRIGGDFVYTIIYNPLFQFGRLYDSKLTEVEAAKRVVKIKKSLNELTTMPIFSMGNFRMSVKGARQQHLFDVAFRAVRNVPAHLVDLDSLAII